MVCAFHPHSSFLEYFVHLSAYNWNIRENADHKKTLIYNSHTSMKDCARGCTGPLEVVSKTPSFLFHPISLFIVCLFTLILAIFFFFFFFSPVCFFLCRSALGVKRVEFNTFNVELTISQISLLHDGTSDDGFKIG